MFNVSSYWSKDSFRLNKNVSVSFAFGEPYGTNLEPDFRGFEVIVVVFKSKMLISWLYLKVR